MRIFYFLIAFSFSSFLGYGQGTTGFSGTGANIDVDNYEIFWRINPDSTLGIKGTVKVKFKTTTPNVTRISLDLRSVLIIDQVIFKGVDVTAGTTRTGNTFSVPAAITVLGSRDSITISYHGAPPVASGAAAGYNLANDPSVTLAESNSNTSGKTGYPVSAGSGNMVNTLSESYEDRDWWPCKADMQDKADTIDITVNVPWKKTSATDTFWVASNGTLVDSSIDATAKSRTFKYINRYPMASYLVCVGVARYNRYYRGTVNIGGKNVPVVYYLYPGKVDYIPILAAMDKATEALTLFSNKFGNYGFTDATKGGKHGFYEGLSPGGGMEHQTFSAIGTESLTNVSILIHELMHQWFGDKVSFSTWNDLWLAEGFAEYSPSLAAETITGTGYTAFSFLNGIKTNALNEKASVRIPAAGIASSNTIWTQGNTAAGYGSTVYNRGAMVLSMLRRLSGDTKYFNVLKNYQTASTLEYKSASTDSLKKRFADSLGLNLDKFFFENVDSAGYPNYDIGYQYTNGGKTLVLKIMSQTRKLGGGAADATVAKYFNNPVVVHVKGPSAGNDTTIVFYDRGTVSGTSVMSKAGNGVDPTSTSTLYYNLSFAPNSIAYDDSARTMSTGSMSLQTVLDLTIKDFTVKQFSSYNSASLILDDNSTNSTVTLERSADGKNFEDFGTMVLEVTNTVTKKYLFNDSKPLENDNYYRATYKNLNGFNQYSKIVKVGANKTFTFNIINNPVQQMLQVKGKNAIGKDIGFAIYDESGRRIKSYAIKTTEDITEIPVAELQSGLYILKISSGNVQLQNLKFLIK
jgi:aminopeptidase N